MKPLVLIVALALLEGCSSLMNASGAIQPVKVIDAKQQIMFTTCSGNVEDWASCYGKARKACVNGYESLEKVESPVGAKREFTFQCK